jgi:hypothetical protein
MAKVTRKKIDEFLSAKSIAVIGASRNKKEYSRSLFQELLKHGFDAIPVNLITGFCMFMFLPKSSFLHKMHGGVMKLIGIYTN